MQKLIQKLIARALVVALAGGGDLEEFDEPLSHSMRLPQIAGASSLQPPASGSRPLSKELSGGTGVSIFHEIARLGDPGVLSQVDLSPDLTGALVFLLLSSSPERTSFFPFALLNSKFVVLV